jgi:hypothetical protein
VKPLNHAVERIVASGLRVSAVAAEARVPAAFLASGELSTAENERVDHAIEKLAVKPQPLRKRDELADRVAADARRLDMEIQVNMTRRLLHPDSPTA